MSKNERIPYQDLPKAALRKMSARQRSYIDEFEFFHGRGGLIDPVKLPRIEVFAFKHRGR